MIIEETYSYSGLNVLACLQNVAWNDTIVISSEHPRGGKSKKMQGKQSRHS